MGLVIGGTSLGVSPTQTVVPSITTAPFLYRCILAFRSIGLGASSSTAVCTGSWLFWRSHSHRCQSDNGSSLHYGRGDNSGYFGGYGTVDRGDVQYRALGYSTVAYLAFVELRLLGWYLGLEVLAAFRLSGHSLPLPRARL